LSVDIVECLIRMPGVNPQCFINECKDLVGKILPAAQFHKNMALLYQLSSDDDFYHPVIRLAGKI